MAGTDLFPVAGARLYIGSAISTKATDFTAADFASQTWTLIDGWETAGAIGDTASLISTDLINRGRTTKQKGVFNAGSMQNVFAIIAGDAGQAALIAASKVKSNFAFKIDFGDAPDARSNAATITIATPGVVTWTAHGLEVGDAVKFTTTGALPTGLTAGTTYYVRTIPDADTFTLSATVGGSAINTTGTQNGTHTATTVPSSSLSYFVGLVMGASKEGGTATTVRKLNSTIEVNSNVVEVAATE